MESVNFTAGQRTLRNDAIAIWRAGVVAVDSLKLVQNAIRCDGHDLCIGKQVIPVASLDRIVVVGAGKAGAGMAAGVEIALGDHLVDAKVTGWINVPADCLRPLRRIHLHAARPAGLNEPTAAGVQGSSKILELVSSLGPNDLCLVLISGGGSALLPAPAEGISLADKLAMTRCLMQSGATIQELNTVRKRLSRIKGGGLLRAARAGRFISLIISDVPDDPLDIIASGPTVCDRGTAADALKVLDRFVGRPDVEQKIPPSVWNQLEQQAATAIDAPEPAVECQNFIIGNNVTAVTAAADAARELGYEVRILGANRQGVAREVGTELAELALATRADPDGHPVCYLAGGEPVVKLARTDQKRRGGRNQEVVLAACCRLMNANPSEIVVLSGGTDGEDGPTDAAGALFDALVWQQTLDRGLDPESYLAINDSYTFFAETGGLLITGPTHTNVMDLQLVLVNGPQP